MYILYKYIVKILSIPLSTVHLEEILKNHPESIFLQRHPIFLLKSLRLHLYWVVLLIIYIRVVFTFSNFVFSHILVWIWLVLFMSRIRISFKIYYNHWRHKGTTYTQLDISQLIDNSRITWYAWKWILISILLCIDIIITIWFQIFYYWLSTNSRIYLVELVIFAFLCIIIMKSIKIQLDFEMDHFIVTSWWVIVIDREWFYGLENKMYIWSQIQTIQVIQSGWVDSFFQLWTVRISTSSSTINSYTKVLSFWKISYTPSIEIKLRAVIYS